MRLSRTIALFLFSFIIVGCIPAAVNDLESADIRNLVLQHAKAWETGDYELLIKLRTKDVDEYYVWAKEAIKKYGFSKMYSLTSLKQLKSEFVEM